MKNQEKEMEYAMTNKISGKRKWAEEVKQWYQDTGAFTYANPDFVLSIKISLRIFIFVGMLDKEHVI